MKRSPPQRPLAVRPLRRLFLILVALSWCPVAEAQEEIGRRKRKAIPIQWAELESKSYSLRHEAVIPAATVERVAAALDDALGEFIRVFKFKPEGKFKVKFLDSLNTYEQEGGDPSHPGKYFPGEDLLILRQLPFYQLLPTAYHEAMHQYLQRYVGQDTNIPLWFNEGMAMYFEGMQSDDRTKKLDHRLIDNRKIGMVKRALLTRTAIPLEKLIDATHEEFHDKDKESLHYTQSFSLAYFLMRGMGARKALEFAKELEKTKDAGLAEAKIFGKKRKKLKKLEKAWKAYTLKLKLTDDEGKA